MTEYNEGDRVRAEKNSTVIEGTLWGCEELFVGLSRRTVAHLLTDGFTITVIEKAAPVVVLPTEPGLYSASEFPIEEDYGPYRLGKAGKWCEVGSSSCTTEFMGKVGTLTRLEPVPETAKKVLERVRAYWDFQPPFNVGLALDIIAKDFGVEL